MQYAFFGTGLMGAGFVRRLLANGHAVNVWNRSPAKAQALEAAGARAFADPAAALHGAERLHLSLADDASVDGVLEPLVAALPAESWIVDHTTTAVRPTAERAARWQARGPRFVHAPVFMAPANAADGSGIMLISGDPARHQALLPELQKMTGNVVYLGAPDETDGLDFKPLDFLAQLAGGDTHVKLAAKADDLAKQILSLEPPRIALDLSTKVGTVTAEGAAAPVPVVFTAFDPKPSADQVWTFTTAPFKAFPGTGLASRLTIVVKDEKGEPYQAIFRIAPLNEPGTGSGAKKP